MTTHATPGPSGTALVIGEALVDVVLTEGADPQEIPGGSPANVALGLARLGRDAALNCWIGKDPRGTAVRAHLHDALGRPVQRRLGGPDRAVGLDAGHGFSQSDDRRRVRRLSW